MSGGVQPEALQCDDLLKRSVVDVECRGLWLSHGKQYLSKPHQRRGTQQLRAPFGQADDAAQPRPIDVPESFAADASARVGQRDPITIQSSGCTRRHVTHHDVHARFPDQARCVTMC